MNLRELFLRNLVVAASEAQRSADGAAPESSSSDGGRAHPTTVTLNSSFPSSLTRSELARLAGQAAGDTAHADHCPRDLVALCGYYLGCYQVWPIDEEVAGIALEACIDQRNKRFPNIPILSLARHVR